MRTRVFHIFFAAAVVFPILCAIPSFVSADESTQEYQQMGAYSQLENAATMVESYRMEGKNAFIRQKTINGQVFYAVIIDHSAPPPLHVPGAEPVVVVEPGEEITLPTYSGMPGSTIALYANTPLYSNSEASAARVGNYSDLGDGRYSSTLAGFHMIWFPSAEEYGYVKAEDVRIVQYMPSANEQPMAEAPAEEITPEAEAAEQADASADAEEPMEEPASDMAAAASVVVIAPANEEAEPEPEPEVVEDKGPHLLIVPVTSADKTESIEIMSDIEIYDRPFVTGMPIGTYDEIGGVFIKEYMGWYALRLPDGSNAFIRMKDATTYSP